MSTESTMGGTTPATPTPGEGHALKSADIDRVVEQLAVRFPAVAPADLHDLVTEEFRAFDRARIPTFIPVLAVKAATARLMVDDITDSRALRRDFHT